MFTNVVVVITDSEDRDRIMAICVFMGEGVGNR